jgi:predicted Zn-dependent protease
MTTHVPSPSRTEVPFRRLPWLIAGAFLLFYLVTMSKGAGIFGITAISKVTGWDWQPFLHYPLYYLATLPFHVLPVSLQPVALNAFSALLAAGTLGLVARSVQLLPHDRTKDQRERERSRHGLLTGSAAWLPATAAAVMCGLQLLFWQNATNASVDMLNLFVLAWVIRELLEYRIDHRERRLVVLAFVYGLGVTSNPALIALFPFMLGALIWVMGREFFRSPILLKLFTAGVAGLLLYLLLPALAVSSDKLELTFWEALRENLRTQKMVLQIGFNNRLFPLVMCLGSLFPLILIGVRWPSNFGDTSAAGSLLTRMMFRVLVLIYIAAALAMNFQLKHAEKAQTDTGLSYHSLFLLSALVIGYSLGYLLVIFGKQPGKSWQRATPLGALAGKVMVGLAWLILPFVAVGLTWQNFAQVRSLNGSPLYAYAANVARQLPAEPALVLSDDNLLLSLIADQLAGTGAADHWLLHTRSLSAPGYHRHLNRLSGGQWPVVPEQFIQQGTVADAYLVKSVADTATNRPVVYLHPSFGYYFEWFHPVERELVYDLRRYTNTTVQVPVPEAAALEKQEQYLQSWWEETLGQLSEKINTGKASIADNYLGQAQSRALNHWGTRLQQAERFAAATPWFERATRLFTNNVSALINLEYNRHHLAGTTNSFALSESTVSVWKNYRDNIHAALTLGGPIDEPGFCVGLGSLFAGGNLQRQAAQYFLRALALTPNNQFARAQLARTFLQAQAPDRALAILQEIRNQAAATGLNEFAQIDLAMLEATALYGKGELDRANTLLDGLAQRYPQQPVVFELQAQMYLNFAMRNPDFIARAEQAVQRHAALTAGTNLVVKNNLGLLAFLKQDWTAAAAHYSEVLEREPEAQATRFNRALANLKAGQLDRALQDYKLLAETNPKAHIVHFGLGEIAERQSRPADALKHFNSYLELAPKGTTEYTNVVARVEQLKRR